MSSATTIAWNRFGLGARPGDIPPDDPQAWLLDQLRRFEPKPAAIAARPATSEAVAALAEFQTARRRARQMNSADPMDKPDDTQRRDIQQSLMDDMAARGQVAVASDTPFAERLVHFWANHFAVSVTKRQISGLAGPHEFEAIRPHIRGSFRDLLKAAVLHPAMLGYLDQAQSTGPNSPLAQRAQRRGGREAGLNENLAREILELHTLGVGGGYSQADVTEFARAMTGWTMAGLPRARDAKVLPNAAAWAQYQHEPGSRELLGRRFADEGAQQSLAMLDYLAGHPATARHIATKLARHFAADDPPPGMVARLERAFLDSDGNLPTVYVALVTSPEAWAAGSGKFRTPWDWTIAALRATERDSLPSRAFAGMLRELGQACWSPAAPKGYDDVAASWAAPDALIRRVEVAERLARQAGPRNALDLAKNLFPGALNDGTAAAVRSAESATQGLALLLASPEMMRR